MSDSKVTRSDQEKGSRRKRLTRDENESCQWLANLFFTPDKYLKPTRSQKQRASLHYRRAIEDAGLEYKKPKEWRDVRETFRAVILELDAAKITSSSAHILMSVAAEYYKCVGDQWEAERTGGWPRAEPRKDAKPATATYNATREPEYGRSLGLAAGDRFTLVPATDIKPRQIIFAVSVTTATWEAGRFIEFCPFKDEDGKVIGDAIRLDTPDEGETSYNLKFYSPYRLSEFQERETPNSKQIAELRARFNMIDADDITDSSARFKLEKQIYDLEQTTPADEWEGFDFIDDGKGGAR
jgi:hypothetical protein